LSGLALGVLIFANKLFFSGLGAVDGLDSAAFNCSGVMFIMSGFFTNNLKLVSAS
jgi:hypothetical protein